MNMQDEHSHYNGKEGHKMKIEKDRMLWGESLPFIAEYVADELNLNDSDVRMKAMGVRNPIAYEYTFKIDGVDVSLYMRQPDSAFARTPVCFVKTEESVEFEADTFGEVVDNIRWLADCEREEVG